MKSFNDKHRVLQWKLETGYNKKLNGEVYPLRTYDVGENSGLSLRLRSYGKDLQYVCDDSALGYTVSLIMPGEAFKTALRNFHVPLSQDVFIAIKAKLFLIAKELRDYKTIERNCYFNAERQLHFYQLYTQKNCDVECLANFTNLMCGCVRYSMASKKCFRF